MGVVLRQRHPPLEAVYIHRLPGCVNLHPGRRVVVVALVDVRHMPPAACIQVDAVARPLCHRRAGMLLSYLFR